MHVAVVSTFYPNNAQPQRATFVRNLTAALASSVELTVVAPVPYAPPWPAVARWRALRSIGSEMQEADWPVFHPRFVVIPRAEPLSGIGYASGCFRLLTELAHRRPVDVFHVHCAYPDAVGLALVASVVRVPFVVTAHGSDVNVYGLRPGIRGQLRWALKRAATTIAVSKPLQRKLEVLAPESAERVQHIPCAGFDPRVFAPRDRQSARRELGLHSHAKVVVFAGHLLPVKGIDILLQTWRGLEQSGRVGRYDRLIVLGEGPLRSRSEREVSAWGLASEVQFRGEVAQEELADWLGCADLVCIPSRSEGTPNVMVEAFASGRPVVAAAVGGIPELLSPGQNGLLVRPEDPDALAQSLALALGRQWPEQEIAATVQGYRWADLASRNLRVLEHAAVGYRGGEQCAR
jgi:glycosyltransferase involved in cell wall biosynthesis